MIRNLSVSYTLDGLDVTLSVDISDLDCNLPYVLSELFMRVMKDSRVNQELLIDNLKNMSEYDSD